MNRAADHSHRVRSGVYPRMTAPCPANKICKQLTSQYGISHCENRAVIVDLPLTLNDNPTPPTNTFSADEIQLC